MWSIAKTFFSDLIYCIISNWVCSVIVPFSSSSGAWFVSSLSYTELLIKTCSIHVYFLCVLYLKCNELLIYIVSIFNTILIQWISMDSYSTKTSINFSISLRLCFSWHLPLSFILIYSSSTIVIIGNNYISATTIFLSSWLNISSIVLFLQALLPFISICKHI